jgi:ATP-dependent DNA helicase RecG
MVVIRRETLASHEEIVMQYLEDNPSTNNSKVREICFIGSVSIAKRLSKRLMSSGLI